MRFQPEEKLEIIGLARYSSLGFQKTLSVFGINPFRVWCWIRNMEKNGLAGLVDQPPIPKSMPSRHLDEEKDNILKKAEQYTHLNHRKLSHQIFRDDGIFVSESLVYRILKVNNLILPKRSLRIESSDSWKNQPQASNEIWHIDISYIPCGLNDKGKTIFWYLVVVLDGYSRYVISWDIFPDMIKERCFEVVDQAIFLAQLPDDKRPRLLSDNGKQFRARKSREFFSKLLNIKQIFTSAHHPETNGKVERLFKSAKYEALYRNDYSSADEAKKILVDFFDYYNNHRLHQAIGYITPGESYYGLNRDYPQRRLKAKLEKRNQRKQYWSKSEDLLTFSKS